jgi:nitroimidazol reductase NimA-like FMN-containing flavoprotein (pyridoxamine 5'-phosphate oxidase superfamily)
MPITSMNKTEREAFLADVHVGVLSIPTEGAPLTAPLWYRYTPGGDINVWIDRNTRKGRLLKLGVQVSLVAQDDTPQYKYVSVQGTVTAITPSSDEAEGREIACRYMGEEMGNAYIDGLAAVTEEPALRISIRPDLWLAADFAKIPAE